MTPSFKSGFTIIELTISMVILGIILAATITIFTTATKNYQFNFQKSAMQKELNYTIDAIANEIKGGSKIISSYDTHNSSPTTIIIGTPAKNFSDNFIYTGDVIELDYIIYYQSGNTIRKKIIGNPLGKRAGQTGTDYPVLSDVSSIIFEYFPGIASAEKVKATINTSKKTSKATINLSDTRVANFRNVQ